MVSVGRLWVQVPSEAWFQICLNQEQNLKKKNNEIEVSSWSFKGRQSLCLGRIELRIARLRLQLGVTGKSAVVD